MSTIESSDDPKEHEFMAIDIKDAFAKLDAANDTLWNKDGTPKLEAIRVAAENLGMTRDEMIAGIGDLRRAAQPATPPATDATPAATPPVDVAPIPAATLPTVAAVSPVADEVDTVVAEAKAKLASLQADAKQHNLAKEVATKALGFIQKEMDKLETFVSSRTVQISHAEAVKRVQARTVANLAANKSRIAVATAAVAAAGVAVTPAASLLDAALAARPRSQGQAAYLKQQSDARIAERLGTQ